MYRCRVDYRNSPTRNDKLNLTIIVPPSAPVLRNRNGQVLSSGKSSSGSGFHGREIGPFEEGDDLEVVAVHEEGGGRPPLVLNQSGPGQDRGNHVELLVLESYVLANLDLKYTKGHF